MSQSELASRTAVISGGLGDIGQAIARELATAGANVAFCDLLPSNDAGALISYLESTGVKATYTQLDVSDSRSTAEWIAEVARTLGTPQIVIPNAATVITGDILQVTPDDWKSQIDVGLHGAFYMAQAAATTMVNASLRGSIVFLGSWAAHAPHSNLPAYCVAKAGVRMLTQLFALELAPHGIMVNELALGYVDAGLSGRLFQQNPLLRTQSEDRTPVHRLIQPTEVASQIRCLCDPSNHHITGATLLMDGGLSLVR